MSDSNRGYRIAALGGVVALALAALGTGAFFGSLYGPAHKQYETVGADEGADKTYQGVTESLHDIALIPSPVERAIANPPSNGGQDSVERDLAAQESMAVWAFYMALAGFGTMFVTLIGTILIWKQVSLTREAVEDTGRLIDLEQAPFVVLRPIAGEKVRYADGGFELGKIRFRIENMGRGPAFVTALYRQWSVREKDHPDPLTPGEERSGFSRKLVEIPIGPGQKSDPFDSWSDRILKPAYIVGPETRIFFYGYIEFHDLSGKRYVAGYMYVFRQDAQALGLHLALPDTRAGEYNYQKALDA